VFYSGCERDPFPCFFNCVRSWTWTERRWANDDIRFQHVLQRHCSTHRHDPQQTSKHSRLYYRILHGQFLLYPHLSSLSLVVLQGTASNRPFCVVDMALVSPQAQRRDYLTTTDMQQLWLLSHTRLCHTVHIILSVCPAPLWPVSPFHENLKR